MNEYIWHTIIDNEEGRLSDWKYYFSEPVDTKLDFLIYIEICKKVLSLNLSQEIFTNHLYYILYTEFIVFWLDIRYRIKMYSQNLFECKLE